MNRTNKGFTLLELMIVAVIFGILALMSGAMLLNAADKAREGVVKSNVSAAYSSLVYKLNNNENAIDTIIDEVVTELNDPDGVEDSGDETYSPYNNKVIAFITNDSALAGQVTITTTDSIVVEIKGYGPSGSDKSPLISKSATSFDED